MTAMLSPSVTVRGPRGAQVCGPVVSRAILVGLVAANPDTPAGPMQGSGLTPIPTEPAR